MDYIFIIESAQQERLLNYFANKKGIRVLGPLSSDPAVRVPIISFVHESVPVAVRSTVFILFPFYLSVSYLPHQQTHLSPGLTRSLHRALLPLHTRHTVLFAAAPCTRCDCCKCCISIRPRAWRALRSHTTTPRGRWIDSYKRWIACCRSNFVFVCCFACASACVWFLIDVEIGGCWFIRV